jgi:hypothetical protein
MDPDAYADDMARFLRLSDEDVERLFRGRPPEADQDLHDLATFLADASECLARPPRSEIEATHLALLAEAVRSRPAAAQGSSLPIAKRPGASAGFTERRHGIRRRGVRWVAKAAGVAAVMVVMTAALALAGVDLPGTAAETAFQTVGIDLPNQGDAAEAVDPAKLPPEASETAGRVLTVIHEWFSGAPWSGCEFGARLSQAARGAEGEPDTSRCGTGGEGGQAPAGQNAGGSANSENGLGKANEASGGAASHGHVDAGSERDAANEASEGAGQAGSGPNAGS